jgi:FkbH-like protein
MFEFEVSSVKVSESEIPPKIREKLYRNPKGISHIEAVTPLLWEEHCTECAMPSCYTTCDLYESRSDGKCRRFKHGISRVDVHSSLQDYIVKIEFKRWGSLLAITPIAVKDIDVVKPLEKRITLIENIARKIPDTNLSIAGRRGLSSRLARRYKRRMVNRLFSLETLGSRPSDFILEVYNPADEIADLTLVIRAESGEKKPFPYQHRLSLKMGVHREVICYNDIEKHIDLSQKHYISIVPNLHDEQQKTVTLFFGFIGFVRQRAGAIANTAVNGNTRKQTKNVKIVVWDLDRTIWDGILVEEDPSKPIELKSGIVDIIKTLDKRGIVNSIISKNDHDNAMKKLKYFGIDEYFVFPEISWEPKSKAMSAVISNFNIGADTVVFIDDSPFEREEVSSQHPQVRVIDAVEYTEILEWPEFNPESSSESGRRREFYRNQKARSIASETFIGDYLGFIKNCKIKLHISHGKIDEVERIHELVQRTNQMNFSGNRYSKERIKKILSDNQFDTFRLQCEDKFGDYGTVAFCVVDNHAIKMTDLAFSCRVQSKRVEHAFLNWLIAYYKKKGHNKFFAVYNQTEKNIQSGKVFSDLDFIKTSENIYEYSLDGDVTDEGLINIKFER